MTVAKLYQLQLLCQAPSRDRAALRSLQEARIQLLTASAQTQVGKGHHNSDLPTLINKSSGALTSRGLVLRRQTSSPSLISWRRRDQVAPFYGCHNMIQRKDISSVTLQLTLQRYGHTAQFIKHESHHLNTSQLETLQLLLDGRRCLRRTSAAGCPVRAAAHLSPLLPPWLCMLDT